MAHVRIALDTFRPGAADEAIRLTQQELVPLLRRQPGFIAYEIVRTGPDTALFIHTCATEAQAADALQRVLGWAQERLGDMIVSVERHAGEVVFSTRA
jgi:quinol monooxygenase YgiN